MITGPDVSTYQGVVDWPAVAASGHSFAITKATEWIKLSPNAKRVPNVDKRFARNWQGIKDAGLVRGAYMFFHPECDPVAQAEHFVKVVGFEPGDLPPLVDLEAHDGLMAPEIVTRLRACLEALEALTSTWPLIYTAEWFWRGWVASLKRWPSRVSGADVLHSWRLWIADYDVKAPNLLGWDRWTLWQHTVADKGKVTGVNARCDLNRFNGTTDDLRQLAGLNRQGA